MTAVIAIVLLALFLLACIKIERLLDEKDSRTGTEHDDCIKAIAASVSRSHSASLMRHLAHKWDAVEEQANLQTLAREQYRPGGPSMPAIWLRHQADLTERSDT